ncbi:MAG TPA: 50S ribosomal protein L25 [Anaerolineae bacterium]|nr:50S ribosomal protein L25 [Anaerolineae bacterium]HXW00516.1 50S ribosomal protein L25 [Anaerolineae bacterium]
MEALELKAEVRQITGKQVARLRRQGYVPAVVYGSNTENDVIQIEAKALRKVLVQAGTHQLIALQVGNKRPRMTLARDIQIDTVKRSYMHVDFYAVNMKEKVTAEVPVILEGVSLAVKDLGGILVQGLNEIEIECLPSDLIAAIEVNIESLAEFDDMITVADLKVPSSITILSDPESMVAKVEPPRVEEEIVVEEAPAAAEPEVLTAAKEQKEEEEG